MPELPVAIACDHGGFPLKAAVVALLEARGLPVLDLGTDGLASVDYPDFAEVMAEAITEGRATRGVLICGTGIGISMAANRHRAVRAAVCHDVTTARLARQHNDANVLAIGARIIGEETARDTVATFLDTAFDGGRHERRVSKFS